MKVRANMRPSISACILTFNSAETIEACLESVKWVDEIIVVDSLSTDRTLEIVGRFTDRVFRRPWHGYRCQFNFVGSLASGEWILWVDSDEVLSPALQEEIQTLLTSDLEAVGGFSFPRRSHYLGRWIYHGGWYPDHVFRLAPRGARWEGDDPHPRIRVNGPVRVLKNPIYHFTYYDISEQLQTIDRYSDTSARLMHTSGKPFSLATMLFHPPWRFFRDYVLKLGFRDGVPGLIIAIATGFYVFMKYAKLWDLQRRDSRDS
jgi:glycosyltransferase involved in cell wall biosynthesis